ncbi:uncharacterized protein PV09_06801 [Verruconis gallopava]|uniref:Uncharacterized protein n=1 Tax=Verruconis gallopava TaxID=253628 RepID=A0A0D2AS11_9PEZI|nr:uncharacterized protein PV09_06801 [Verruconis gallopava]KIW01964.1 hypothetical protein PV09_06801 [Verruconis gallopava]
MGGESEAELYKDLLGRDSAWETITNREGNEDEHSSGLVSDDNDEHYYTPVEDEHPSEARQNTGSAGGDHGKKLLRKRGAYEAGDANEREDDDVASRRASTMMAGSVGRQDSVEGNQKRVARSPCLALSKAKARTVNRHSNSSPSASSEADWSRRHRPGDRLYGRFTTLSPSPGQHAGDDESGGSRRCEGVEVGPRATTPVHQSTTRPTVLSVPNPDGKQAMSSARSEIRGSPPQVEICSDDDGCQDACSSLANVSPSLYSSDLSPDTVNNHGATLVQKLARRKKRVTFHIDNDSSDAAAAGDVDDDDDKEEEECQRVSSLTGGIQRLFPLAGGIVQSKPTSSRYRTARFDSEQSRDGALAPLCSSDSSETEADHGPRATRPLNYRSSLESMLTLMAPELGMVECELDREVGLADEEGGFCTGSSCQGRSKAGHVNSYLQQPTARKVAPVETHVAVENPPQFPRLRSTRAWWQKYGRNMALRAHYELKLTTRHQTRNPPDCSSSQSSRWASERTSKPSNRLGGPARPLVEPTRARGATSGSEYPPNLERNSVDASQPTEVVLINTSSRSAENNRTLRSGLSLRSDPNPALPMDAKTAVGNRGQILDAVAASRSSSSSTKSQNFSRPFRQPGQPSVNGACSGASTIKGGAVTSGEAAPTAPAPRSIASSHHRPFRPSYSESSRLQLSRHHAWTIRERMLVQARRGSASRRRRVSRQRLPDDATVSLDAACTYWNAQVRLLQRLDKTCKRTPVRTALPPSPCSSCTGFPDAFEYRQTTWSRVERAFSGLCHFLSRFPSPKSCLGQPANQTALVKYPRALGGSYSRAQDWTRRTDEVARVRFRGNQDIDVESKSDLRITYPE